MSVSTRRVARRSHPFAWCALVSATMAPVMAAAQVWQPGNLLLGDPVSNQVDGRWGSVMITGDFDGDGRDDLAAATPFKDRTAPPPTLPDAGQVAVYLSGTVGLAATPDVVIGGVEDWQSGYALAAGDFDGDGDDELAVSRPGSSVGVGSADHAGGVWIFFRSGDGTWFEESVWYQGGGIPDASEPFDQIGQALAVGDFDADLYDDLVVGIPGENLETPQPTLLDAGAIAVLYGSPSGLTGDGAQFFHEGMGGLGGGADNARFGFSLATGHFSDDLYDDLVVGIPYRDAPGAADAGQIVVLFGGPGGLSTAGFQRFDDAEFGGAVAAGDRFGYALAAGRFRETGALCAVTECYDQLVLGIPGEPVSGSAGAGGFLEVPGSSGGLVTAGAIFWHQGGLGSFSSPEAGDHLGEVLVAGALDARPGTDLVVGVPAENWAGDAGQGCIHLVFGGPAGLLSYPSQGRIQDGFASGPGAAGDRFGASLAIGDFNSDGTGDLAVGIPGRDASSIADAGRIQLFRGALFADGFESHDTSIWSSTSF